mmetsp:Transcript_27442/g.60031  ORF Transcript_27442/g.60031 Transcript_27442/m.60031 type:complete len:112 (+) Transcript_27442:607-942(+)
MLCKHMFVVMQHTKWHFTDLPDALTGNALMVLDPVMVSTLRAEAPSTPPTPSQPGKEEDEEVNPYDLESEDLPDMPTMEEMLATGSCTPSARLAPVSQPAPTRCKADAGGA